MGWIAHAVVDVALGLGLLIAGLHGHGTDYLVLDSAAGYLLAITVLTRAPGGIAKRIPRFAHRVADGVVAVAMLASPLLVWRLHVHIDVFATAMAEAVGVILLRDAIVTDHRLVGRRAGGTGVRAQAIETTASESPPPTGAADLGQVARRLGRASATVASQIPDAGRTARLAGFATGRAHRAARAGWRARKSRPTPPT